ncbi:response regulator [Pontibacter diazotrophicus]|uniref:histidine kinase n=1 Tax=Pontibacter diazotrophicus TaxID=1400979 RepID=A0A3D8L5G4_9BACT|nr:ATP-binding protein [Pontibacter diazotrophicus]RDV12556.1 response regulator [Pontibacter diazotrophicus]
MKLFRDSTKTKVIVGFGLALSIVLAAIYLTYTSFTKLLNSVDVLSRPNNKLAEMQYTLATISTAESSIRAYTLTTKEEHFKAYLSHLDTIQSQIDSLQFLMRHNPQELAQVDSIASLLQAKQESLERYVALKKEQQSHDYSVKAMRQIASTVEEQPLATTIKQHTTTTISDRISSIPEDTLSMQQEEEEPKEEKRGFLNKIFSKKEKEEPKPTPPPKVIVPQLNVTQEIKIDTNATATPVAPLAKVRRILHNVQRESDQKKELLLAKELALLQQDKYIMDQVRNMMYKMEYNEQQRMLQNSLQARTVATETSMVLLLIGVFGLIAGIAFIIFILRDLTRSNNYKTKLIKAQKEAVQLARAKEAFVANMSHEMRTPLNVILGFSQQLRHTPLLPQQEEHLQAVNGAGEHLLHIVNDVLDLSKIEAGKLHINRTAFSLKQLLKEVEQAFALKASTKRVHFIFRTDETIPDTLQGDALHLKQVLFNLVDNAIKFTHQGQVLVSVRLKSIRRTRVVLSIAVADTGIGIQEERIQHVFGEFNQADNSILRKYGGTGLGLSISKKLVEMLGGTLSVHSTSGKGTTFTFVLPLQVSNAVLPVAPASVAAQPTTFQGFSALVIDDDAYSRKLCELILSRWGMQVHLANDGHEAMAQVQQHKFDVVLTDIQLPGMSGKTVARNIRRHDKEVPILALTANILSNDDDFFKNSAITDHLLKPFTEQDLHQKLIKALPVLPVAPVPAVPAVLTEVSLPEQPTTQLYDLSEMRLFTGPDNETLVAVLEVLLADQRQNLEELESAAAEEQWEKAANVAHKMLTAFKHLKAHTVTPDLLKLEQVLHTGRQGSDGLQETVEKVKQNTAQVLAALQQEVERLEANALQPVQ